jgi:predicted ArsR family transcriptional regulator
MNSDSTRTQILAHLNKIGSASAVEISSALNTSKTNVQYHLKYLINQGRVRIANDSSDRAKAHTGRPTFRYELTPQSNPNDINQLASALLDALISQAHSQNDLEIRLAQVAERLFTAPSLPDHFTSRLNTLIKLLNNKNYQARWEIRSNGPRIIFGRCPYLSLLPDHPEICKIDQLGLSQKLTARVEQLSRIDPLKSATYCAFQITQF